LSTFFSHLSSISPDASESRVRAGAVPVPGDISAAFRSLAEAFEVMRQDHEGGTTDHTDHPFQPPTGSSDPLGDDLLSTMISALLQNADTPPSDVQGVSEEFIADLSRVPKKTLQRTPDAACPICNEPFLDDKYPLVVRLPCHKDHLFDLECVRPWLRLKGTCPLDRRDFGKEQREREEQRRKELEKARAKERVEEEGEEEEEWDGLYG
jgi:hypothetical protein